MKKFALFIVALLISSKAFSTTKLIIIPPNPKLRGLKDTEKTFLTEKILFAFQETADVLNNSYISIPAVQEYINSKIKYINSTNTNYIIRWGRKIRPRKLRPIRLRNYRKLYGVQLRQIRKYMDFDGVVYITARPTRRDFVFLIEYLNEKGRRKNRIRFTIPRKTVREKPYEAFITLKEKVFELFKAKNKMLYETPKLGKVNIVVIPYYLRRKTEVTIKSLGKSFRAGLIKIPYGKYQALIQAKGYEPVYMTIESGKRTKVYRVRMKRAKPIKFKPGEIPYGKLIIEADVPNAKFIIPEAEVEGRVPKMIDRITVGKKTIIFDETPEYKLKTITVEIKTNEITHLFVDLEEKGSQLIVKCNENGAVVAVDRKKVGIVSNGIFTMTLPIGNHRVSVFKDTFTSFTTNVKAVPNENIALDVVLNPKLVPSVVLTPQSDGAEVKVGEETFGKTPFFGGLPEGKISAVVIATNIGFDNVETNLEVRWGKFNETVANLSPLFGDLRIVTKPDGAAVFIDDVYRGATEVAPKGLLIVNLPAKFVKLKIERENYKTILTNIYVIPHKETTYEFKLKEAPAKVFFSTSPEKGAEIYINGELAGLSGKIINVELGRFDVKIKKPGFKTVLTNIVITEPKTYVVSVKMEKGKNEDDIINEAEAISTLVKKQLDQRLYVEAYSNVIKALSVIDKSDYVEFPEVKKEKEKILAMKKEVEPYYQMVQVKAEVENLLAEADKFVEAKDYTNAFVVYNKAIETIETSPVSGANEMIDLKQKVEKEKEKISQFIVSIKAKELIKQADKLIKEGDKFLYNEDYREALKKYEEAVYILSNPDVQENADIEIKIAEIRKKMKFAQEKKRKKEFGEFINKVKDTVADGDYLLGKDDYKNAIYKYNSAIALIDKSRFRRRPEVIELRKSTVKRIKEAQAKWDRKLEEQKTWWQKMSESWSGLGFRIGWDMIKSQSNHPELQPTHTAYGGFAINFIPILGFEIDGYYNFYKGRTNYVQYFDQGMKMGLSLRIPIVRYVSLFGVAGLGFAQLGEQTKSPIGDNFFISAGMDIKYRWIGLRFEYFMPSTDNFNTKFQGFGAGIVLWLTEK